MMTDVPGYWREAWLEAVTIEERLMSPRLSFHGVHLQDAKNMKGATRDNSELGEQLRLGTLKIQADIVRWEVEPRQLQPNRK